MDDAEMINRMFHAYKMGVLNYSNRIVEEDLAVVTEIKRSFRERYPLPANSKQLNLIRLLETQTKDCDKLRIEIDAITDDRFDEAFRFSGRIEDVPLSQTVTNQ